MAPKMPMLWKRVRTVTSPGGQVPGGPVCQSAEAGVPGLLKACFGAAFWRRREHRHARGDDYIAPPTPDVFLQLWRCRCSQHGQLLPSLAWRNILCPLVTWLAPTNSGSSPYAVSYRHARRRDDNVHTLLSGTRLVKLPGSATFPSAAAGRIASPFFAAHRKRVHSGNLIVLIHDHLHVAS